MDKSGFTLVELLVVLALGSILLAFAVPGYVYLTNASRRAAVTNDLVTALHLARSEAIRRVARVTLCTSGDSMAAEPSCNSAAAWQDGWIVFVDGGTRGVLDGSDEILRVYEPSGVTLGVTNFSSYISYVSNGRSQGPNGLATGTFSLCLSGVLQKIILNNTGRIRLDKDVC